MDATHGPPDPERSASSQITHQFPLRVLRAVRLLGLLSVVVAILCFPVVAGGWEFVEHFRLLQLKSSSLWVVFFEALDSGGQSVLARALLRMILCWGCILGLLLPLDRAPANSSKPYGALFVLWGALAVALSCRPGLAEQEWETWALSLLFACILRRCRHPWMPPVAAGSLYLVSFLVFLHALWLGVPGTYQRLGGVFHHANALSTFCLMVLPFFFWRCGVRSREAYLASLLAGGLACVLLWSGSLTGTILLTAGLGFWSAQGANRIRRYATAAIVGFLPLGFNLVGGWMAVLGFPLLLLLLLGRVTQQNSSRFRFSVVVTFLLTLTLCSGVFAALAPVDRNSGVVHNRSNSGSARLDFYRSGLVLVAQSPLFGCGPRGFGREYPSVAGSVAYFSQFVHCLPLEVAVEWGLPALLLALGGLREVWSAETSASSTAFRWSLGFLFFHGLTGVQSQFPVLIVGLMVCWGSLPGGRSEAVKEFWWQSLGRFFLALFLLFVMGFNLLRATSDFDAQMGLKLFRIFGDRALTPVEQLLESSCLTYPLHGQSWLHWSNLSLNHGKEEMARLQAERAIFTDPRWAAPRLVWGEAQEPHVSAEEVETFLAIDPLNYPTFYRFRAENLVRAGRPQEALDLLRDRADRYSTDVLLSLPDFRADDLQQQLVEYWLLVAILEEQAGRPEASEQAFRTALFHCQKKVPRLRSLLSYPDRVGISAGKSISGLFLQLSNQLPAENLPGSIEGSSHQTL